jgi:hypothetical protein
LLNDIEDFSPPAMQKDILDMRTQLEEILHTPDGSENEAFDMCAYVSTSSETLAQKISALSSTDKSNPAYKNDIVEETTTFVLSAGTHDILHFGSFDELLASFAPRKPDSPKDAAQ